MNKNEKTNIFQTIIGNKKKSEPKQREKRKTNGFFFSRTQIDIDVEQSYEKSGAGRNPSVKDLGRNIIISHPKQRGKGNE